MTIISKQIINRIELKDGLKRHLEEYYGPIEPIVNEVLNKKMRLYTLTDYFNEAITILKKRKKCNPREEYWLRNDFLTATGFIKNSKGDIKIIPDFNDVFLNYGIKEIESASMFYSLNIQQISKGEIDEYFKDENNDFSNLLTYFIDEQKINIKEYLTLMKKKYGTDNLLEQETLTYSLKGKFREIEGSYLLSFNTSRGNIDGTSSSINYLRSEKVKHSLNSQDYSRMQEIMLSGSHWVEDFYTMISK